MFLCSKPQFSNISQLKNTDFGVEKKNSTDKLGKVTKSVRNSFRQKKKTETPFNIKAFRFGEIRYD